MSHENDSEEILITSDEAADVEPRGDALRKVTLRILQEKKHHGKRKEFYILDGKFLGVKNVDRKSQKKYWANLLFVDPELRHERTVTWPYIYLALILSFFGSILLMIDIYSNLFPKSAITLSAIVLLFTGASVFVVLTFYYSNNMLILYSQHGKIAIAEFFYGNPSKKELGRFIDELESRIEAVKSDCRYTKAQLLPAEVAEYRRLYSEGIISENSYESAKMALFSHH